MIVPSRSFHVVISPFLKLMLLLFFVYDVAVSAGYVFLHWRWLATRSGHLASFGAALCLFLAFRTNIAYQRWWEARTLWGATLNASRAFGRQVCTFLANDERDHALRVKLVYQVIAFSNALRCQLRNQPVLPEVSALLEPSLVDRLAGVPNIPNAILTDAGRLLGEAARAGRLNPVWLAAIDDSLRDLTSAQGGMERIKNTPFPRQYDVFPLIFVHLYCLLLPLGLVESLGLLTPFGSVAVGIMFLGLDKIGRDLETPFADKVYDVPMTALSRTIEIDLRQQLGEKLLPPPIKAVDGVLW